MTKVGTSLVLTGTSLLGRSGPMDKSPSSRARIPPAPACSCKGGSLSPATSTPRYSACCARKRGRAGSALPVKRAKVRWGLKSCFGSWRYGLPSAARARSTASFSSRSGSFGCEAQPEHAGPAAVRRKDADAVQGEVERCRPHRGRGGDSRSASRSSGVAPRKRRVMWSWAAFAQRTPCEASAQRGHGPLCGGRKVDGDEETEHGSGR